MIYPTARAIGVAAIGAPVALACGLWVSGVWPAAAVWGAAAAILVLVDGWLAGPEKRVALRFAAPEALGVAGGGAETTARLIWPPGRAPRSASLTLETSPNLIAAPAARTVGVQSGEGVGAFRLSAARRGDGAVERLWARWRGPLGLAWRQRVFPDVARIALTPDIRGVRDQAAGLFARDGDFGVKIQREVGEGAEFHTLREFQSGMDSRTIDWTQSARHGKLISKEYRAERNHPVILALDTGRLMSEPLAGAPKLDRALNAALLMAYVGLGIGDRVGLFAFDARPRLFAHPAGGVKAFAALQRQAARIDYSVEETNFTLALTTLGGALDRRALVVVFTEFADPIGAELMLESAGRIARRHLVLFVLFRDGELEALAGAEPLTGTDISRAVIADTLLRQRQVVVNRLRRLGVEVLEADAGRLGPGLVARYLELKRGDRL